MARRKLLLADDSVTIQKVVNLTFADEGIDVKTVGDGDAAMESIGVDRPDIVLADVNMPGHNGYQICELLRSDEATRHVPVILLVGSFEPFDESEAARVGANAYLTKPFQSIRQLVAQVSELMDSAGAVEENGQVQMNEAETQPSGAPERVLEAESSEPENQNESALNSVEPQHFDDLGYPSQQTVATPLSEDIDSLYDQSLSGGSNEDLSEIDIDDEMIETSYAAETAQQDNSDLEYGNESGPADVEPVEQEASIESNQTETSEVSEQTDPPQPAYQDSFYTHNQNDPSRFESTIAYENWKPADMRDAENGNSFEETPELTEPAPFSPPAVGEDTIRMDSRFDTTGSANFHFDEVDLLDLEAPDRKEVEITTPLNAIEQGSNKQLVSLSPELIEMIAQRVVEKLSEKY